MRKHAYLIIAHHEFELLQNLISMLDDARNELFIHIDQKVKDMPVMQTKFAKLHVLIDRIDVSWGDVSQIETELLLFRTAHDVGHFAYYHLMSGVDLPLKNQDYIHNFFEQNHEKEFIGFSPENIEAELERKVRRYHLFPRNFRNQTNISSQIRRAIRFLYIAFQDAVKMRRHSDMIFKKGACWVSVTHEFVGYLLTQQKQILKTYHHTYCADEIFLQTLCWNSPFRYKVFNINDEEQGCMRKIGWRNNKLFDWTNDDYDELISADAIFARKFSSADPRISHRIMEVVSR